jgi:hypothetical protein
VSIAGLRGDALANALMRSECVPLDSEILTRDGWKRYDEVTIGEEVLAYDCESDICRWTPVREVTVYPEAPTVSFGTELHHFRCTPDHSWAVKREPYVARSDRARGPYANRKPERGLVKATDVKSGHRVILAAPAESGSYELTPAEAALLGWIMCDGTIKRVGNSVRLGISQSKPERIAEIRPLLKAVGYTFSETYTSGGQRTFPSGRTYRTLPQTWFYLSAYDSRALLVKAGISGPGDLPKLVTRLSSEARQAMLAAMMAADGTERGVFGKKRKPGVMDAWQILATLEGKVLGVRRRASAGDVPVQRMRTQRYMAGVNVSLGDARIEPVWCPTTDYGTWVMRQDGMVTITGNTKSKRRATLSLVGLGWLDETETETIPDATRVDTTPAGDIVENQAVGSSSGSAPAASATPVASRAKPDPAVATLLRTIASKADKIGLERRELRGICEQLFGKPPEELTVKECLEWGEALDAQIKLVEQRGQDRAQRPD